MRIRHIKGVEELIAAEPLIIQKPENFRGKWRSEVFGNAAPLYLEIGIGMGRFIRTHSFLHPEIDYIGFELNASVMYKAVKRYREELEQRKAAAENVTAAAGTPVETAAETGPDITPGSCNLRFIRSNARFLEEYFMPGEVDRIYLNFSDPWPKKHSAGRRLTAPQFLKLYDTVLAKDGILEFKTDNRGLFDYSVETLPENGWKIDAISYDLHHDPVMNSGNVMTEYEEKFSADGSPIFRLTASR